MEIEAKFRVDDRTLFAKLLQFTTLGPFSLAPTSGIEHQQNTYFDTSDRRLTARGYTLRIRDLGNRRIATVKRSLGMHGGVHMREEWEVPIGTGDHPHDWPISAARARALEALDGAAIVPLLTIHTRRQYIYAVRANTTIAELSLDEGAILAGGSALAFRELEVELLADGTRADLDMLVNQLQARFRLPIEPRGKKARGLALLDRVGSSFLERSQTQSPVAAIEEEQVIELQCDTRYTRAWGSN